jgi:hypothetical protein
LVGEKEKSLKEKGTKASSSKWLKRKTKKGKEGICNTHT